MEYVLDSLKMDDPFLRALIEHFYVIRSLYSIYLYIYFTDIPWNREFYTSSFLIILKWTRRIELEERFWRIGLISVRVNWKTHWKIQF